MDAAAILSFVLQLIALFPTLEPAFVQAVRDFETLFNSGQATQADVDALIDRVKSQSATIQAMG